MDAIDSTCIHPHDTFAASCVNLARSSRTGEALAVSAPSYHRWLVVAITVLNQAVVTGISFYCFAIFSIPWLDQFDVNRGQLVLAITSLMVANGLAAPFIGHRLDKMSLLWPVTTGYILFCTGLGLLSIANAYWQIILVYATLFAVSQILAGTFVSQMLINRWFASDNGLALGISATGTSVGGILFPLLVAQALSTMSLSAVLLGLALILAAVLIPMNYAILRVQPPSRARKQAASAVEPPPAPDWTTQKILRSKAFWIPLIVLLFVSASFVAIQANLGVHLNDLSYPAAFTGQVIAVISAMMIVGKLLYGRLADRLDHAYLLLFMGSMSIVAIALLMSTSEKALLLTAAVLLGIASGGLIPMQGVTFVARFGVASFGKVMGLVMLVMVLGSLGSVYAAWIYDLAGSYHYAFISFILMTLPGLFLLRWLPPPLDATRSRNASMGEGS